jgi:tetratricopeptide (TPR) repeat protein
MKCEHGKLPGSCKCFEPRIIVSVEDAEKVLQSGRATWDEWAQCSSIFANVGRLEDSSECIVKAIEEIQTPNLGDPNLVALVGRYVGFQADEYLSSGSPNRWLKHLSQKLMNIQRKELLRKHYRFSSFLDAHIAETLILATDNSKYGRVSLAARLRNPKFVPIPKSYRYGELQKRSLSIRWGKPEVALPILNQVLAHEPHDVHALNTRAMVHIELGNLTDAELDAELAFKLAPENDATKNTLASVYIHGGFGIKAFNMLRPMLLKNYSVITFAFMYVSFSAMTENQRDSCRAWLEAQRPLLVPEVSERSQRAVILASIKILLNAGKFRDALQFLAELERESWGGNTQYWQKQILFAAKVAIPPVPLPTLEELIERPEDLYPNHSGPAAN